MTLCKGIRNKFRQVKDELLTEKCAQIERINIHRVIEIRKQKCAQQQDAQDQNRKIKEENTSMMEL